MTTPTKSIHTLSYFFIRHDGRNQKIVVAAIAYLEAQKNYVRIVTRSRDYLTIGTLKQLLAVLPPERFVRIHRAYVVNLDWVEAFDRYTTYGADQTLPIGEAYVSALRSHLVLIAGSGTTSSPAAD